MEQFFERQLLPVEKAYSWSKRWGKEVRFCSCFFFPSSFSYTKDIYSSVVLAKGGSLT